MWERVYWRLLIKGAWHNFRELRASWIVGIIDFGTGTVSVDDSVGYAGTSSDGLYYFNNQLSAFQIVGQGLLFDVGSVEVNMESNQLWESIPGGSTYLPGSGDGYAVDTIVQRQGCVPEPLTFAFVGVSLLALGFKRKFV